MSDVAASKESRRFGPVRLTDFVRYAGAGGDFNPLHHDDAYARAHGHPGPFAQGLLTAGYLSSFLEDWVGYDAVERLSVRFVEPVWPGEELVCKGEMADRGDTSVSTQADLVVENAAGRVKVRGTARIREGRSTHDK